MQTGLSLHWSSPECQLPTFWVSYAHNVQSVHRWQLDRDIEGTDTDRQPSRHPWSSTMAICWWSWKQPSYVLLLHVDQWVDEGNVVVFNLLRTRWGSVALMLEAAPATCTGCLHYIFVASWWCPSTCFSTWWWQSSCRHWRTVKRYSCHKHTCPLQSTLLIHRAAILNKLNKIIRNTFFNIPGFLSLLSTHPFRLQIYCHNLML